VGVTVLHVRLHLITVDPLLLGECVSYSESEVRPAVESQPGSLGMSLLTGAAPGGALLETFWASYAAMKATEKTAESLRGEMARRGRGTAAVECYEVPVFEREGALHGGEAARLTRMEVKRPTVDDVTEAFGDTAVPLLTETTGFDSALLFADPASGHLISETVWRDPQARTASPSVAAVIRADVLDAGDCVIRAVDDYRMVFSSARKA